MTQLDLTVISPLLDEEASLRPLHAAIVAALEPLGASFEIVLVDDGSHDGTFGVACEIAREDARVRVVRLRRNFGQTAALAAGIDHARGKTLVTLDGDLQNDPADIPRLLEKIGEGFDVVCGRRVRRNDPLVTKRIPSFIANRLISLSSGSRIHDHGCTLRAYRADALHGLPLYAEMHRLIPALATLGGRQVAEVGVSHRPRSFGRSKYGLARVYGVSLDLLLLRLLLTFSSRPLAWFGCAAAVPAALGLAGLAWASIRKGPPAGPSALMAAGSCLLLAALAVFLLAVGILAELACRGGKPEPAIVAGRREA